MNDYDRIARVIAFLDDHAAEQPTISQLADVAGLSESHFHRLFRRWAGATPKDFLQVLTVEDARRRLAEGNVFDAALDCGLSGPGRLHDLAVTLEAATPGEIRRLGEGLTISWGSTDSPFGPVTIGWTERGITHLSFHPEPVGRVPADLSTTWTRARFVRDDHGARARSDVVFSSRRGREGLAAFVQASPFQLRVWRALLQIPEGEIRSYAQLAAAVGSPKAARAVGTACGANPIAYLIPCHRVIRETGVVRGYRWGSERKQAMIAREVLKIR